MNKKGNWGDTCYTLNFTLPPALTTACNSARSLPPWLGRDAGGSPHLSGR